MGTASNAEIPCLMYSRMPSNARVVCGQIIGIKAWGVVLTLTLAPDARTPETMEAWFRASLRIRQPLLTRAGMTKLLVAKPMPSTIASSLPTKEATSRSSSVWIGVVPAWQLILAGLLVGVSCTLSTDIGVFKISFRECCLTGLMHTCS